MPEFHRRTHIAAPLERVWEFHSTVDGLRDLTPRMANLRVESITLPEGSTGSVLVAGSELRLSIQPIPVGPRISWTSLVTDRSLAAEEAYFVDEMRDGPMTDWRHTHTFSRDSGETVLTDHVSYRTGLGRAVDAAMAIGLKLAFADRHRRTREILGQA